MTRTRKSTPRPTPRQAKKKPAAKRPKAARNRSPREGTPVPANRPNPAEGPMTRQDGLDLLRRLMDDPKAEFRPGQWEAVDQLVNQRGRLLMVQRTGWGKSAVYFLAARIRRDWGRGPTVVVSPLLALMRDQVKAAERLGLRAVRIDTTNKRDWPDQRQALADDQVDVLLVSPERLANDGFMQDVLLPIAPRLGLFVVDEAHCISDWGHDFRPDYRRLAAVLPLLAEGAPVLAATATANRRVADDVRAQLGDLEVQRGPLARDTLALQTLPLMSPSERLAWLARHIPQLSGSGIVYVLTQPAARRIADWLVARGIDARAYHKDVKHEDFKGPHASHAYRQHLEDLLLRNEVKLLVATNALGMGFDKPDLGFVVHYQAPASTLACYQQVGRAGRAVPHAVGVLMGGHEDAGVHEHFRNTALPKPSEVQAVLDALEVLDPLKDDEGGLKKSGLEEAVNLRPGQIERILALLAVERPPLAVRKGSLWRRTGEPYRPDPARHRRLTAQRQREWQEMQDYLATDRCRMAFLAASLDDASPKACGKCAVCLGRPVVDPSVDPELVRAADRFLRRSEAPLACPTQVPGDALKHCGFKGSLPRELQAETGRVLCWWHDEPWGRMAMEDVRRGRFRPELAEALAEVVRERWRPEPPPAWVACVPSRTHPNLVPDLARRLAEALDLPFYPVVSKVRDNEPQQKQRNGFHQCRNLVGVFRVEGLVPPGPVLLVDDVVGSGWTLTAVAALLLQAGSGPVYPLALASSRPRC